VLQAFTQMHQSETRAEETYKVVVLKYPKSVKILRAYVRFLREIKNDPWKAQRYDLQADNYEQVKAMAIPFCVKPAYHSHHAWPAILAPEAVWSRSSFNTGHSSFAHLQAQMEAAKEAAFAANIGVGGGGGEFSNLLSEDNPDGVVMITEEGKITFVNKVLVLASAAKCFSDALLATHLWHFLAWPCAECGHTE